MAQESVGFTGNALLDACETQGDANKAICIFYIIGIVDGYGMALLETKQPGNCRPLASNNRQLACIIHERWSESSDRVIRMVFR